ncbi:MAG TPA: PAS domain S-box protein [Verrucomicrobiae bacterium]|nr:PAS domain S-box protein [Verrucomicrobiae bacterium]
MAGINEQSRLRAVVDTAVDGVILIDARGVILMFNPACERLFGYASFEVIGRNVKMLMPEPYQSGHDAYLKNYRDTGERKIIGIGREVLGRKRNGATFPMDLSVGESEEEGAPIYVGIIRDLTERRASEQAVREGGERLRAVVETAVDGVILIDAEGRVLMFNPACERLFGYRADEVVGQNVRMLMPGPYREEHDSYIGNYLRTSSPKVIGIGREVEGQRKDGTTFPMDLSVGEAQQEDKSIFVGIIHDLSARKRTEEQLVQAQKMETVGQLSGGIAHDFNNLLTVILGNAEALSSRLKARADLRNVAETIVSAAERGAELTQRLLAFSRRQMLQPAAVNCTALVENMRVLLKRTLRENIDLRIAVTPAPVFAMADPAQLENALLNLSINAQDAMPNGGVLTLSVDELELDETMSRNSDVRPGRYISVCVTDDGEGMTKETLERAFEPFYTTKEVGKGSGLGLSMVYGFVKQSNGHIAIYSERGLGTSVRLYLPIAEGVVSDMLSMRDDFASNEGGDETILIVEDDPFVRSHVISSLEQLGYRTMVAADGREALNMLQGGARPDLLFTDIVMPGGFSGWEVATQARALLPGLRVLFTSGYPQETLTRRGQLDQHAAMLSKPYRLAELARRVRETLDSLV